MEGYYQAYWSFLLFMFLGAFFILYSPNKIKKLYINDKMISFLINVHLGFN